MSLFKVFKFVEEHRKNKAKAIEIREDPERQPKSKRFGVSSIIFSVFAVAFAALLGYGVRLVTDGDFLTQVAGFFAIIFGVCSAIFLIFKAIEYWAFQALINKKAMTWISLVFWILAIGGSVGITLVLGA